MKYALGFAGVPAMAPSSSMALLLHPETTLLPQLLNRRRLRSRRPHHPLPWVSPSSFSSSFSVTVLILLFLQCRRPHPPLPSVSPSSSSSSFSVAVHGGCCNTNVHRPHCSVLTRIQCVPLVTQTKGSSCSKLFTDDKTSANVSKLRFIANEKDFFQLRRRATPIPRMKVNKMQALGNMVDCIVQMKIIHVEIRENNLNLQLKKHSLLTEAHKRQIGDTSRSIHQNKDVRMTIGTWNVAGKSPHAHLDVEEWLCMNKPTDIYVLG